MKSRKHPQPEHSVTISNASSNMNIQHGHNVVTDRHTHVVQRLNPKNTRGGRKWQTCERLFIDTEPGDEPRTVAQAVTNHCINHAVFTAREVRREKVRIIPASAEIQEERA